MINLYELEDITLLPGAINNGHLSADIDFLVSDELDVTGSNTDTFPIFTSPMPSIVGSESAKIYDSAGIRPIIPSTENIDLRLDYCAWVFCAFTIAETRRYFLTTRRESNNQFHVCIDAGNGHDAGVMSLCNELKKLYGGQILLMGGNVANPGTYEYYSRAGFDYMRVGIAGGSLVDKCKYGFHYPLASLLNDIKAEKSKSVNKNLRPVKIIADGGIDSYLHAVKCLALGADYVMIGRDFARVLEAEGEILMKSGQAELTPIDRATLPPNMDQYKIKSNQFSRYYWGNTTPKVRAERAGFKSVEDWEKSVGSKVVLSDSGWESVSIELTLDEWIDEFKNCAYYSFMMTNSTTWKEFKENVKYAIQY